MSCRFCLDRLIGNEKQLCLCVDLTHNACLFNWIQESNSLHCSVCKGLYRERPFFPWVCTVIRSLRFNFVSAAVYKCCDCGVACECIAPWPALIRVFGSFVAATLFMLWLILAASIGIEAKFYPPITFVAALLGVFFATFFYAHIAPKWASLETKVGIFGWMVLVGFPLFLEEAYRPFFWIMAAPLLALLFFFWSVARAMWIDACASVLLAELTKPVARPRRRSQSRRR